MKRNMLALLLAVVFTMAIGIGIAYALPTSITDSTGTSVAITSAKYVYNTQTGGLAEHSYSDRPANLSFGPHGKYTTDTNACGRCHQLHQAQSAGLIRFNVAANPGNNDIYRICTFCHNFNGQSTYDVKNGMIWDAANGFRFATEGGGFVNQLVVEGPASLATLVRSNSSHRVNVSTADTTTSDYMRFLAPGGGANEHIALKCSSCHNPHGSSNARILVENVVLFSTSTGTVSTARATYAVPEFVYNRFGDEDSVYPVGISEFCAACHTNYLNKSNSGSQLSNGAYRHMVNVNADNRLNKKNDTAAGNDGTFGYEAATLQLPLGVHQGVNPLTATNAQKTVLVCTSCHFAHGTGSEMTREVIAGTDRQKVSTNDATGKTVYLTTVNASGQFAETIKNLRMDNRGVCQNCHNRNSVNSTAPALAGLVDPANINITYSASNKLAAKAILGTDGAGNKFVTIRFNQYMAKVAAETVTNYTVDPDGPTTTLSPVAPSKATLMPDGRTVLLNVPSTTVVGGFVNTTVNLRNINNVAHVAESNVPIN
ncbi:MAG: cytochrome c3 family protein [Thermincolia bacterium]